MYKNALWFWHTCDLRCVFDLLNDVQNSNNHTVRSCSYLSLIGKPSYYSKSGQSVVPIDQSLGNDANRHTVAMRSRVLVSHLDGERNTQLYSLPHYLSLFVRVFYWNPDSLTFSVFPLFSLRFLAILISHSWFVPPPLPTYPVVKREIHVRFYCRLQCVTTLLWNMSIILVRFVTG